jgi:hypothetical protein
MNLPLRPEVLTPLLAAGAALLRELRLALETLTRWRRRPPTAAYETLSLALELELLDPRGERAVLRRRQRLRFLRDGAAIVRELVWGDGEQLVRYQAQGARRLGVRAEGSKRAVLLDPAAHPAAGDQLTITSRRTIRGGFLGRQEYCEVYLERPTGRLEFTIIFPATRPPLTAQLVRATTEAVVRQLPLRYRADGRAVVRCRLQRPDPATTYSVRWAW